ncbi:MAG: hypothetical protein ACRC8S_09045 [Fimbriiglobus sp.]
MQPNEIEKLIQDDLILGIPMIIGGVLWSIAALWMVIQGFVTHWGWGLSIMICGSGWPAYLVLHFRKAILPTLLAIVGIALIAVPSVMVLTKVTKIQQEADARKVTTTRTEEDGTKVEVTNKVLTLTGAKREEYAKMKAAKDWTVIQWANKDVTDEDTEDLHGLKELVELDLSNTQVTAEGLHVLEDFPKLQVLKLARTAIQLDDKAFADHIAEITTLKDLDVRGSRISKAKLDEWKAKVPGRKYLK